ncbi:hypothetical protein L484_028065 [Morus notabilis]|uniref:Uncharacterized protein n=1 Tax=Morus notabilis TaxID=981085 RepID=W9S819_9ROSA|nr:hypothetical protein L484_028065 [Morus notabilis]
MNIKRPRDPKERDLKKAKTGSSGTKKTPPVTLRLKSFGDEEGKSTQDANFDGQIVEYVIEKLKANLEVEKEILEEYRSRKNQLDIEINSVKKINQTLAFELKIEKKKVAYLMAELPFRVEEA